MTDEETGASQKRKDSSFNCQKNEQELRTQSAAHNNTKKARVVKDNRDFDEVVSGRHNKTREIVSNTLDNFYKPDNTAKV